MKSPFCNWSDVRVFLAVFRAGSTLAASKSLGMAQPTVARRIEALEHALGLSLFERTTRGFAPTRPARSLFPRAEALEKEAAAFAAAARDLSRPQTIRVTAFSANFSPRANAIFTDFSLLHPEVGFEFLPGVKVLDLMKGEADVALRLTREPPHPDLIQRKISIAQFALYASKSYADEHGLPTSESDFEGHEFISFRRDDIVSYFDIYLRARVAPEQIVLTCNEPDLLASALRAGRGIALQNVRLASQDPNLIQCFDPPGELDSEHLILVSPEAWRRPEVKSFVKFFAPRYAAIYK